ncbi:ATPase [Halobaculum limi]|uniref:ATPase n=1 Tax=Halobaculum limi TaxID=3031916 RepID=UPI002406AFBA|nr:ATPase [Halobaculum sp. YSMS11]
MRLLVVGADRVDAGKTTFAVGLAARLRAERSGDDLRVYKPRAGNDYWFDHDDVRRAIDEGRLYGKDVARLLDAAGSDAPHETRNPIHRLWRPTPDTTGLLGESGRSFVVDRVTTPEGDQWVVNGEVDLPSPIRRALPLDDARRVSSVREVNTAARDLHLPALDRLAAQVRESPLGGDAHGTTALVESYGDVALPLRDVRFDAVAAVDPGRCRVYDGDRWAIARDAAVGDRGDGTLEVSVSRVTEMLDPVSTHALCPLTGGQRSAPDAVAETYTDAYKSLVAQARKE